MKRTHTHTHTYMEADFKMNREFRIKLNINVQMMLEMLFKSNIEDNCIDYAFICYDFLIILNKDVKS